MPPLYRLCSLTLTRFALSALSLSIASLAHAQELVDEVSVVGRRLNLVGSATSASEGRISQEELALRPLLRTGDVLETVPGLVATQHSGSGKANQFFLRGFNLDHGTDFATFVDGMPVNMRTHGHGQGYTDLNFLIPELLGEITYRKGSYYADAGDFSGTGTAQLTTAAALDRPLLSLTYGQYDYSRALLAGSVATAGNGTLLVGAEAQGYAGPWDQIDEDVAKRNLWLKYSGASGMNRYSLALMAYDNTWNSPDQIPERAVQSGLIGMLGSIDPTVGGNSSRFSLSGTWQRTLANGELRASAYAIDYDMQLWSNFSYFTQAGGDQFEQIDQRRLYGGQLAREWRHMLGSVESIDTVGVQLRFDDIDQVGLRSTAARQYQGDIRLDRVGEDSTSLYWQNTLRWTPRLRTTTGLRYDYYDFDVTALAAADASTLADNSGTADADLVTAYFGIGYELNDGVELYANIGQGFHSNDARGTTITRDPVSGDAVDPVDPLVDTLGSEMGVRVFLTDRWNASAALWHLDIDSELLFVGDAGNTEDTGVGSERTGLELTSYFRLDERWSVDMEYSYTDARFTEVQGASDAIPGALEHVFSGGLNLRLNDAFNGYLRVRHFADYPLDEGQRAEPSTLVSLRMAWNLTEHLNLSLDVLNLLDSSDKDVQYYYESQLAGETEPVADRHFHVFEPRSARLYANYRF